MSKKFTRRSYLAALAISGSVAGCAEDSENDENGLDITGDSENDENGLDISPKQGNQKRPTPQEANVSVTDSRFLLGDSVTAPRNEQIPWGVADIQNTSSVDHGLLRIEQRFYESDNTLLEARDGFIHYLPANATWRHYKRYYTKTPSRVNHVETQITETNPTVKASKVASASVLNSEMNVEPESGVDFAAEIDLGGANINRAVVFGLFYDDAGRLRGTVRELARNPSQTVAVSSSSSLIRTPPNLDEQISSYEVLILDGFP